MSPAVKVLILIFICFGFVGCTTTKTGKALEMLESEGEFKALPVFEEAALEGSTTAAIMASFLYLTDHQIPINIDKAKHYYHLALSGDRGQQQYLDYYIPQVKTRIMLMDDNSENDGSATDILRGRRYSEYPSSLRLLALTYSFGKGVEKSLATSKRLFERAIELDNTPDSNHMFAWWLAVHPDEQFRDSQRALDLLPVIEAEAKEQSLVMVWDTQAAVYAANGRYKEAIEYQSKALQKLREDSAQIPRYKELIPTLQCRLRVYQEHSPWFYEWGSSPFNRFNFHRCRNEKATTI
ncbi:sel1 repeat family protein [Hahella ganghwensis]|uniref:sel1 repeat family protein n=1 Tax=Hahella ganghwensis TaxID=286420 RepID=UPI0003713953|nr:sel1 repeat family protein [Hahella ganghwensis]